MRSSAKTSFFVNVLLRRGNKRVIKKITDRRHPLYATIAFKKLRVSNGRQFKRIYPYEYISGYKLGEFSSTRQHVIYMKAKKAKKAKAAAAKAAKARIKEEAKRNKGKLAALKKRTRGRITSLSTRGAKSILEKINKLLWVTAVILN